MSILIDPVTLAIERYVEPGMICFDIGANTGRMAAAMAAVAKQVYAFEPVPELASQIMLRDLENVLVFNTAVSDKEGEATFHLDDRPGTDMQASSLRGDLKISTRSITVPVTTIDAFVAKARTFPDFIKIDVEGCEELALRGGMGAIRMCRPILTFEVWGYNWPRFDSVIAELADLYHFARASTGGDALAEYRAGVVTENDDVIGTPK